MKYFSEEFLAGLRTKSVGFQRKFEDIMCCIDEYFDSEEEKQDFHEYIEQVHFYYQPGNLLYSSKKIFCGLHSPEEHDEICNKIHFFILDQFENENDDAMVDATHIIIAIAMPESLLSEEDMEFIRKLVSFERVCRGYSPAPVTTILNDTSESRTASCFVAALK